MAVNCDGRDANANLPAATQSGRRIGMIGALLWLIDQVVWLAIVILIGNAILSWLVAFNVINTSNRAVYMIWDTLNRLSDPILRPIRRIMPNLGGIDISPVIAILGLQFVNVLARNIFGGLAF
jgi:YggT family protein